MSDALTVMTPADRVSFIYGLTEPDGSEIRYVGKGVDPSGRYRDHIIETNKGGKTHRHNWIRGVLKSGRMPGQVILQVVPFGLSGVFEMVWIHACRRKGHRLTNATWGGDGIGGFRHTHIAKEKMASAHRGKSTWNKGKKTGPLSPEHCDKISKGNKGIKKPGTSVALKGRKRRPLSTKHKADISATLTGHHQSPETCAAKSTALKGRLPWNAGKKCPTLSAGKRGKPWSPARRVAYEHKKTA